MNKKSCLHFLEMVFFYLIPTAQQRTKWLKRRKKVIFLGERVHWQPRKFPADGIRLKIHNNVAICSNVEFTMHDIMHWVFEGVTGKKDYVEYRGCIEIHENVFIGAGSRILPDVSIGPNAIVAAGSLVNKDVPEGVIVGGCPARIIGSFEDIHTRRRQYSIKYSGLTIEEQTAELWEEFESKRR